MAKQTCVSSLWQKKAKLACLSLAASLFLSACGGGYDGGGTPDQPSPTATPAPVDVPDPTLEPTPPSIEKSEAPSKLEYLNRGLVVVPDTVGNAVSWRLLGTDNPAIVFDVYRNDSKLNETPLTHTTFYKDVEGQADDVYQVRGMVDGTEVSVSASAQPWSAAYHSVPLQRPKDGRVQDDRYEYTANDASVADLDGDGQYEIVLKWMPRNIEEAPSNRVQHGGSRDNSQAGITAHVIFDAYTLEGVHLWRIDLGPNIRAGAHYNPFLVYDFDGDGRAEMAVRTADGSIDGRGVVIGDPDVDYRNENGFITEGPEFVTMFDGLSGEALDSIDYVPARGSIDDWGSNSDNGNRADRFLGAVAYLDGENPSLIMSRGVYARVSLAAFDWVDGAFQQRWLLDTGTDSSHPLFGGGNHNLAVGDVDADGKQEIIYGSGAIDDDGSVLYGTGLCDGDAMHMGDLDPDREGLEVFVPHESSDCYGDYGVEMHDAATGEILWSMPDVSGDIGRGLSANIDPRHPGNENWAARGNLTTAAGVDLGEKPDSINFAIWWEGDLLRELLDGSNIYKWNYTGSEIYTMLAAGSEGAESNNGTKANPSLSADLFGDWREEAIWPNKSHNELMIFSTPHTTNTRMHTLMHDPQYRAAVAWQNVSYNQPPTPSFFVGQGMPQRWESDIAITEGGEWAKLVAQGSDESIDVRLFMNGFDVDAIKLYRDTDDDPEGRKLIATLSGDERSFVDEGDEEVAVVPDVYYYYWAELEGSTASSTIELDVSRTKLTKTLLPSYWVGAIPSQGDVGPVKVIWETENIASDEINIYRVEAASADETPNFDGRSLVGMPEVSATEWVDDSSAPDTAYFYWVEFVDDAAEATYTPAPRYAEHLPIPVINLTAEHIGNTIVVNWELSDFRPAIGSVEVYRNTRNTQDGRTRVVRGASESGTFSDDTPPASATDPDPAIEGRVYWYTLKVVLEDGSQPIIPLVPEGGVFISSGEGKTMVGAWAEAAVVDDNLQLELSWKNYHVDIASVEIFRDTQEDGANRVSMGAVDATATSWKDISPVEGATHYYWVEVTDTDGVVHTSTVTNGVSRPPETNLLAVPAAGGITVSWDLKYFPAELTSIELYRNTSPTLGGRDRIAAGLPMSGSLLDDGTVAGAPLEVGQTYWYMFKLNGGSPNTDPEAEVTYVLVDGTNLVSTQVGNNVELIWNMHGYDFDIASAELYRNDSNSIEGRTKLADVASNGSYVDTGPFVSGTSYWYMFKLNDDVDTDPEAELAYTLPAGTNLSTSLNGDGNIEVSWNLQNYPFDITSVELYRNDRGDKLDGRVRLAQGLESSATFVDDGSVEPLQAGTSYWYMFKLNGAENTSPEAEIVYTGTGIPAATNLTSAINGSAIDLSWDIQGYTLDGTIDLYRNDKDEPNGRVRVAADVGASGTFSDDGSVEPLFAGVDYWYMFKINGTGENTPVEAQITYGTAPPAGLNMTSAVKSTADGDVIEVRWNLQGFAGQDGTIELYRIQDGVSGRKRISRSVKPWGVFEDNGDDTAAVGDLVSGATYSYQFKFTSNNQSSDAGGEITFP
ncbi:hypothetical protein SAMN02745866_00533 [Alteromonadaceae bacterium Bs31]|nr:hypothetical protein SAMN02745866_00533 [Alteromonadaceae bacterium Bs31]